ncbi:MAG: flagellar M-ring protein FliF [Clostridium sp.]|nr:flagellar M-ring protein FliF [Clostridium sp.]
MNSLLEGLKKFLEKFKSLSKGIKIASIMSLVTLVIAITSLFLFKSANKYSVLFSGLESADSQTVLASLEEQAIDFKVEGNSILVDKSIVDKLRLQLASNLTMGSTGYELMDSGSSFGMTDEEFKIKKLRMLQGELEKTIKSFEQISDARVHVTLPKESVFAMEKEPGSAAVYVKLAPGKTLSAAQVKSIVALVSGSTSIDSEYIQVMDSNMNLISNDIYDSEEDVMGADTVSTQLDLEKKYETDLQKSILELLTPVLGNGKVKVVVNADLDFDSKKITETVVDPNKVIISQNTVKSNSSQGAAGGNPIDDNMSNNILNDGNAVTTTEEQTTNYEVGKIESTTIKAPGEVKMLSASVIVDGEIGADLQKAIETSVSAAVGLNAERGDVVSVVGITFNNTENENVVDPFAPEEKNNNNNILYIAIGSVATLIMLIIFILARKRRKAKKVETLEEENLLDVIIDEKIDKVQEEPLKPIDFEMRTEQQHLENEIRKYAAEKPQQVADIVKSWLVESER